MVLATQSPYIHVLSLGAGWQSSCVALMANRGEIKPMPVVAIFADTGWESRETYRYLDWLETELTYPVVRVSCGRNIREDQVEARVRGVKSAGQRYAAMPYYTTPTDPTKNKRGKIRRQCTREYKIDPINRWMRSELLGLQPRQRVPKYPVICQWRGISTDEASRLKDSTEPWVQVRYPLAIELGMSRGDCMNWILRHGFPPPPRSACIGCPFHDNHEWRDMKLNRPDEFADAVAFDKSIRSAGGMRGETFLHASLLPLDEVDLSNDVDRGQGLLNQWAGECEGMCGL